MKSRIIIGSLLGAVIIQVVLFACSQASRGDDDDDDSSMTTTGVVPDAMAQTADCLQWEVRSVGSPDFGAAPTGLEQGWEPFAFTYTPQGRELFLRRCIAK
jgi:hypothetical protein